VTTWLIAPPGTRIGEPGWMRPWPGLMLLWERNGVVVAPPYAVQRNGVMLCTGLPLRGCAEWAELPECPECLTLAGLHHDPGCTQPCEACHDARNHTRWHRG